MGTKKKLLILVFIIVLGLITISPLLAQKNMPEKDKYGGILRIALFKEPMSLDARYTGGKTPGSNQGYQHIYDHLVECTEKGLGEMRPALAVEWTKVNDLTWHVKLRKGVKYHNGKELTAQDVAQNLDWKINSKRYTKEKGWKPARVRSTAAGLKSVEAIDRYTLRFNLEHSLPAFETVNLAWGLQAGPIDPAVVEKYGRRTSNYPVGTGPFKFAEYVPGSHIVLERFDDYWGIKPYIEKVIFRTIPDAQTRLLALQKGEVDIAELSLHGVASLKNDPNIRVYVMPSPARIYGMLWFNLRRWPMSELKFRQAVAMGADWKRAVEAAFPKGTAVLWDSLLKGSWAENPDAKKLIPAYDPDRARKLLKEVEIQAGKPIPPIYTLGRKEFGGVTENLIKIAANNLKKIGLNMDVHILEQEVAKDMYRRTSEFDIALASLRGPASDPGESIKDFDSRVPVTYHDRTNIPGYKNLKLNSLIDKSNNIYDRNERKKIFQELESIVLNDLVAIPLCNVPRVYGVRKNVHDFKPHPSAFLYITTPWNNIWIEK